MVGRSLLVHEDQPQALEAARKHFEAALKLDPNYAPALAGLSHVEGYYYRDVDSNPAHDRRAEQLARQAFAIEPQLPEAHIAMGRVFGENYKYKDAITELHLAVQEEPDNALAWDMLSWAFGYATLPKRSSRKKLFAKPFASIPLSATRNIILAGLSIFRGVSRKRWRLSTAVRS